MIVMENEKEEHTRNKQLKRKDDKQLCPACSSEPLNTLLLKANLLWPSAFQMSTPWENASEIDDEE